LNKQFAADCGEHSRQGLLCGFRSGRPAPPGRSALPVRAPCRRRWAIRTPCGGRSRRRL